MADLPPAVQSMARRMLEQENDWRSEPAALAEAAERVNEQLRDRLACLIGLTGYTMLVARALRLSQLELPALTHISVHGSNSGPQGSLHGVRAFVQAVGDSGAAEAGLTTVLAHILGLLAAFIGEDLALRLVQQAPPKYTDEQVLREGRNGQL